MDLESNAGEVAAAIDTAAAELADLEGTNERAGQVALEAIGQNTPVKTGTLAAGGRVVADALGFTYVNATPYATIVDTRTGFATDTLRQREAAIAAVYEGHIETALAPLT